MENNTQQPSMNDNNSNMNTNATNNNSGSLKQPGYVICLIAAILGLITGVILLITSFVYWGKSNSSEIFDFDYYGYSKQYLITGGIVLFIFGCLLTAFNITNLVFISRNLKNPQAEKHQIFIAVVAIILGDILGIIGGIFVLIGTSSNKQN